MPTASPIASLLQTQQARAWADAHGLMLAARALVASSRGIRAQISRRRLASPARRLMRLCGGSDTDPRALLLLIGRKLQERILPTAMPTKTWFGRGTGQFCDACDTAVLSPAVEVEAEISGGPILRFHRTCLLLWEVEVQKSLHADHLRQ